MALAQQTGLHVTNAFEDPDRLLLVFVRDLRTPLHTMLAVVALPARRALLIYVSSRTVCRG